MITVHVLVDQYIHSWDGNSGELWYCIRPHVSSVADFLAWARDPDTLADAAGPRFDFVFPRADEPCPAELFAINLPAGIDLWHGVSKKGESTPVWTRYARSIACKDATGAPYSSVFNQTFSRSLKTETESNVLSSIEQHFYSGGEFDETKFQDRFATATGQPIPVFRPNSGSSDTSMFWLLGLMHRVGEQSALDELKAIATYDLLLVDGSCGSGPNNAPPSNGRLARCSLPNGLPGKADEIERAYFADWLPALPKGAFPPEIGPVISVDLPSRLYCKPPRRNLTFERTTEGSALFRTTSSIESPTATQARSSQPTKLVAMEIEVVRSVAGEAFNSVDLQLGLRLTGRLQPYRRTPMPLAPSNSANPSQDASRMATIVEFQPDENCAVALARFLLDTPAADVDRLLTASFRSATVAEQPNSGTNWSVEFVGSQAFAWEESRPRIRLLATPPAGAPPAEGGKPRGLAHATAKVSIPSGPKVTLKNASLFTDEGQLTHTIGFWSQPTAPIDATFNAVWVSCALPGGSVNEIEDAKTRITQVFLDDYDFERAQHATSIEGSVTITTALEAKVAAAAAAAGIAKPKGLNPYLNYAQGFADFNVLRQSTVLADGKIRQTDWNTQSVSPVPGCNGQLLGIAQQMPFIQRWPETPRDAKPGTTTVDQPGWMEVRKLVAETYRVPSAASNHSISLALRHTFGAKLGVRTLSPSLPLEWPVVLPTAAETRTKVNPTAVRDGRPFVRVDYSDLANKRCTITFDPSVLAFDPPPAPTDAISPEDREEAERKFASGMLAWRALGELCDPGAEVSLALLPVGYDLFRQGKSGRELASDWQSALRDLAPITVGAPTFAADLRTWASNCFAATSTTDLKPFSRTLQVDAGGLAAVASIGQFEWVTTRSEARDTHLRNGPNDNTGVDLAYVTQRIDSNDALHSAINNIAVPTPGITSKGRPKAQTLEGAWQASQASDVPVGPADAWASLRKAGRDTITPQDPPASAMRSFEDVMQSLRDGTDWFPIVGSPNYSKLTVTPSLVPCGFCPVAPHPELGSDTERLLETTLATFQDYVDLTLPVGAQQRTEGSASDWRSYFQKLEDASAAYTVLVDKLVAELLRAQPANDAGTTKTVALRSASINGSLPQDLRTAARSMLLRQPSLYRTMKAFLLSELSASGPGATLSPLAGAQFKRWTKPLSNLTDTGAPVSVQLDVGRLVALEPLPSGGQVTGNIGFLETLEDALYDNSFIVRDGAQQIEPFEAVIDADAASNPGWMWKTELPTTPIASEQGKVDSRTVPLASRRPVTAPVAIGAVPLCASVGSVVLNDTIKLSKLLEGGAGTDAAGDYIVEAVLALDTSNLRFEDDVFRLVYIVEGDEEGDEAASPTAFQNDLFSLETSAPDQTLTSAASPRPQQSPGVESALSKDLRLLGAAIPRTAEARQQMEKILPSLAAIAADYIKRPMPGKAPNSGIQIQVSPAGDVKLAQVGPAKPEKLRCAAVLKPRQGSPVGKKAMRVLVLDVMTDVWSDIAFALRQSRNAGVQPGGYKFDPYFLTTAVPKTPPARHRPTKAAANVATDWKTGRLLKLPSRSIDLMTLLSLVAQADVGSHTETLLTPHSAIKSGYRLVVTVWAEQFQRPQWGSKPLSPDGRHLPWTQAYDMSPGGLKNAQKVEFTSRARHFSIDLQWWTPSGESALRLERVFAIA